MKKFSIFLLIFSISICFSAPAEAKTLTAKMVSEFDSTNPQKEFCVQTIKQTNWIGNLSLEEGCIIKGNIIEVVPPHTGKRNAYFIIAPTSYTIPSKNNQTKEINTFFKVTVKPYCPKSKAVVVGKVATVAANTMMKGVGVGINFLEGAIKADKGENRLKSGALNAYDNSVLSYIKTGTEIYLKQGDIVKFSLEKEIFN